MERCGGGVRWQGAKESETRGDKSDLAVVKEVLRACTGCRCQLHWLEESWRLKTSVSCRKPM